MANEKKEPGLTYYDNRNKVENTLLTTNFTSEIISQHVRRYTRVRTKSYSYIGLSKSTARSCVTDKT